MTLDEGTRRDIVEAKEALERAEARWYLNLPGAQRTHTLYALKVLNRILDKEKATRRVGSP
jgi:hypothetical protein